MWKIETCIVCGSNKMNDIEKSMEFKHNDVVHTLKPVPAVECVTCEEVYFTPESSRLIDAQIATIKSGE